MRRTIRLLALLFLFAANVAVLATGAAGQPSGAATATAVASAGADFDNDGFADLAVGVPGENDFSGTVNVLYGSGWVDRYRGPGVHRRQRYHDRRVVRLGRGGWRL